MSIFINDPRVVVESFSGYVIAIKPDDIRIEFEGQNNRFVVSLLSNGNLKVVKFAKEESSNLQVRAKLVSSLANEIIIC